MIIKDLKPAALTRVLWLHHEVFADSACTTCPGRCCGSCASNNGYAPYGEPKAVTEARKKQYGFDAKAGFQGEHGCKLPITERSDTCVGFACSGQHMPGFGRRFNPPKGVNKPFWGYEKGTGEPSPRTKRLIELRDELSN